MAPNDVYLLDENEVKHTLNIDGVNMPLSQMFIEARRHMREWEVRKSELALREKELEIIKENNDKTLANARRTLCVPLIVAFIPALVSIIPAIINSGQGNSVTKDPYEIILTIQDAPPSHGRQLTVNEILQTITPIEEETVASFPAEAIEENTSAASTKEAD